ncbi:Hypothetical protein PHPALM_3141 [Phytophthora palmivora]|uniref:Uncharacterized protein n=1 Tax=Phytophthora palmivora TaxID=4796 RepID=A0A2P4YN76_9STRA|nr:Hypothetical protein PHPALM_3141 [Phytophthora palmivora]
MRLEICFRVLATHLQIGWNEVEHDLSTPYPRRRTDRANRTLEEYLAATWDRCRMTGIGISRMQDRISDIYQQNLEEQVSNVGDQVYLSTRNLGPKHTGLPNSFMFGPKWFGPYTVVNIQTGNELHTVYNTGSLKPHIEPTRLSKPSQVIFADGSVGKVIKSINGKRRRKRRNEFLVQWVGEGRST